MRATLGVFALISALFCMPLFAQQEGFTLGEHYVVELEVNTAEEFRSVLLRAEELLQQGALAIDASTPVTFVLHGPEVHILLRQNYLANKPTVDLAASLSALGVVQIKACETWMGGDGIAVEELQPFVKTVPYGPAEARRLVNEEGYLSF